MRAISAKIKICGLTGPGDVETVNAAAADYAGFVMYEKSRRHVTPMQAAELLKELDRRIRSVAVCVSPKKALLDEIEALGFDIIQIHGTVTADMLNGIHTPVWQAVNLSSREDLEDLLDHPRISGYLIDGAEYGSGRTFAWQKELPDEIRAALGGKLFILAGGLNPSNVREGIRLFRPDVVDVSSGVERPDAAQGQDGYSGGDRKDRDLVLKFTDEVRKA